MRCGEPTLPIGTMGDAERARGAGDRLVSGSAPSRGGWIKMRPQAGGYFDKSGAGFSRRHSEHGGRKREGHGRLDRAGARFGSSTMSFPHHRQTQARRLCPLLAPGAAAPRSQGPRPPSGAPARALAGWLGKKCGRRPVDVFDGKRDACPTWVGRAPRDFRAKSVSLHARVQMGSAIDTI